MCFVKQRTFNATLFVFCCPGSEDTEVSDVPVSSDVAEEPEQPAVVDEAKQTIEASEQTIAAGGDAALATPKE